MTEILFFSVEKPRIECGFIKIASDEQKYVAEIYNNAVLHRNNMADVSDEANIFFSFLYQ